MVKIFLNSPADKALKAFVKEDNISEEGAKMLAGLSGRGYRPPTTVARWREIWQIIKKHVPEEKQ